MNTFFRLRILPCLLLLAPLLVIFIPGAGAGGATAPTCPDLAPDDWYYQGAEYALESGFLSPRADGTFAPGEILIWDDAIVLAGAVYTQTRGLDTTEPAPVLLAQAGALLPEDQKQTAHRQGFVYLLDAAVAPQVRAQWPSYDYATTYPYCTPDYVARFYRAGILSGVAYPGDFQPDKAITRAEAAVILYLTMNPQVHYHPDDWPIWMDGVITYEILMKLNFSFPGATDPLDPPFLELEDGRVVGCHAYFTCLAEAILPLENPYTFAPEGEVDWQALSSAARQTAILRQVGGTEIPPAKATFLGDLDAHSWYQAFSSLREYGPASQTRNPNSQ